MRAVSVILTDREAEMVDALIQRGFCKSRADLLRQAAIEFAFRRGISSNESK